MKKLISTPVFITLFLFGFCCFSGFTSHTIFSLSKNEPAFIKNAVTKCGEYKRHKLFKGPKGGCYYINKSRNKTYVERDLCRCN